MYNEIQTAINLALQSIPGIPVLVTENVAYKSTLLTPWVRTTLLPTEPVQVTIGADRTLRFGGLMQVDYFTPANSSSIIPMVDTIVDWFNDKDNRFMTQDGQLITILLAWRGTSAPATDWYRTPIFVRFQAYDNL